MATSRWIERLQAIRRASFTGRERERDVFTAMLAAPEPTTLLLYFYGPGGVGKTTLLRQLAHLAEGQGAGALYLDSRIIDATPEAFTALLIHRLEAPPDAPLHDFLAGQERRFVLLLDTYELLRPLDDWLREEFAPGLPENVFLVIGGRTPPSTGWREDPAWQLLMRALPLGNLTAEESCDYLSRRAIPAGDQQAAWEFTRGHPLALSLVADLYEQQGETTFAQADSPDIIGLLVDRLAREAPSQRYRAALEASALVRVTNESLLAALLDDPDTHDVFAWLRELSLMDAETGGLFPHDLARGALARDVRWRKPDWYAVLHRRAREYYVARLMQLDSREQRRLLFDYIFLHRDNPMVKPFYEWQAVGTVFTDQLRPDDHSAILEMIEAHEGPESAAVARHWLRRQPEGVAVIRRSGGIAAGVWFRVAVERASAEDRAADPAIARLWEFIERQTPLRPNETATCFRFWLAQDSYQGVSPVQSRIFLNMVQHYLTTPGLAYIFLPCADPDFWSMVFAYADLPRRPELDFTAGGRTFGMYMRDWRVMSPLAWLELMGDRELSAELPPPVDTTEPVIVLGRDEFAEAVRDALRNLHDSLALADNPLHRSRLMSRRQTADPDAGLRQVILEAVDQLQATPKQRKQYRALYHVYVQPAPSQEAASEIIDLPFSTFRRHLRQGVQSVTEALWRQELE